MNKDTVAACGLCPHEMGERYCVSLKGKAPANCPTLHHRDLTQEVVARLDQDPGLREFTIQAALQEGAGYGGRAEGTPYPIKPRIVEVVEFAQRMKFRKLALAFCLGLRKEARVVHDILAGNGFEVMSVGCKTGRVPKSSLGITPEQQIAPCPHESMCNPVLQALVANRFGAELNILLGLCVGHDSLFLKHAQAYTTVLAVKDRLMANNPLGAIYTVDSYYRFLKKPLPKPGE